jgi:hypothetical protein
MQSSGTSSDLMQLAAQIRSVALLTELLLVGAAPLSREFLLVHEGVWWLWWLPV